MQLDISNKICLTVSVLENVWKGALFYDSAHIVINHLSSKTFKNHYRFYPIIGDGINSEVGNWLEIGNFPTILFMCMPETLINMFSLYTIPSFIEKFNTQFWRRILACFIWILFSKNIILKQDTLIILILLSNYL